MARWTHSRGDERRGNHWNRGDRGTPTGIRTQDLVLII
nr:MAG TPA: hypothetical protein [Siphoviridae sp. ctvS314]